MKIKISVLLMFGMMLAAASLSAQTNLRLDHVVPDGRSEQHEALNSITLKPGFWAQTGSEFTASLLPYTPPDQLKKPKANKKASLIFFYYGDNSFDTFFQETLRLKHAMEDYKFTVMLKHEGMPIFADLSQKDEKIVNIKAPPTRENLFKYILELTEDGYYIDIFLFTHGWNDEFKASNGNWGSDVRITNDDILHALSPGATGYTAIPIRILWGTNCYGKTMAPTWRSIGAKVTAGAQFVFFYPTAYGPFIKAWNKGNVTFEDAVRGSFTNTVKTIVQQSIALSTPRGKKGDGDWNGCPFGRNVLGNHDCAKEYFTSFYIRDSEWQEGKSGKDNMNNSSFMFIGGDRNLTKNKKPKWD